MEPDSETETLLNLLVQYDELARQGKTPTPEELCPGNADLQAKLRDRLTKRRRWQAALDFPGNTQHLESSEPVSLPAIEGFEIGELLGRGGMGLVYKARQQALQRDVAIKFLLAGANANAEERTRFLREAKVVAAVHHPNIVQIYEVAEQKGFPYQVLEFVGGGNLAQHIQGQPMPPRRAAQLILDLARAVQHSHEQGIVHRDLKPANVLLTENGVPKIADFGLAKLLDMNLSHTQTGAVLGSPSYMAPEQAEGKVRTIGPATDVYALGAVLYELLTGRPPFVGSSFLETLEQVRSHEPAPPHSLQPKVPADLETICLKCLEKNPNQRYSSAASLAEDLERFLRDEPISAKRMTMVDQVSRLLRHSQVDVNFGAWSTLALCLAPIPLVAHLAVFLFFRRHPEYPVIALVVSMVTVITMLYFVMFGKRESFSLVSTTQRRQLWSTWAGHVIGFIIIPVTIVRMVNPSTPDEWFVIYALWLAQVGATFYTFAASAGFLYITGSACFILALILPWIPSYAPLVVGLLMTTNITTQGLLLRRLAKEEQELKAQSQSSSNGNSPRITG